jgi:hypothetical protein
VPPAASVFRALTILADIGAVLCVVAAIWAVLGNRSLLGPAWTPLSRYILALVPASATLGAEGVFVAFRAVLIAALWAFGRATAFDYTWWLIVVLGADTAFTLFLRLQPPCVLVLTNSTSVGSDFLMEVHHTVGVRRAVGLLRIDQMSPHAQNYAIHASLRVSGARDWQAVVEVLSELVPIIIVDTRNVSAGLSHEASRMLQPDRIYKTVFVVGAGREVPVLNEAIKATSSRWQDRCDAMAEECQPLLKRMLRDRAALPRRGRDAATILRQYREVAQVFVEL